MKLKVIALTALISLVSATSSFADNFVLKGGNILPDAYMHVLNNLIHPTRIAISSLGANITFGVNTLPNLASLTEIDRFNLAANTMNVMGAFEKARSNVRIKARDGKISSFGFSEPRALPEGNASVNIPLRNAQLQIIDKMEQRSLPGSLRKEYLKLRPGDRCIVSVVAYGITYGMIGFSKVKFNNAHLNIEDRLGMANNGAIALSAIKALASQYGIHFELTKA